MKIEPVNPAPAFFAVCIGCGKKLKSDEQAIFADLDGEPFKAYYCQPCSALCHADIYDQLRAANVPLDSHESDLYALVNAESKAIIDVYEHKEIVKTFINQQDGAQWFDIPFAFTPFWIKKQNQLKK